MRTGPKPGEALLNRVIFRVWESGQHAHSQEAFQLTTILLRMLEVCKGKVRAGRGFQRNLRYSAAGDFGDVTVDTSSNTSLLDRACQDAFGMRFAEWGRRNELRKSQMAWELAGCIPDYDPLVPRRETDDRGIKGGKYKKLHVLGASIGQEDTARSPQVAGRESSGTSQ